MAYGWLSAIMVGPDIAPMSVDNIVLLPTRPEELTEYLRKFPGAEIMDLQDNKLSFKNVFRDNHCDIFDLISQDCSLRTLNTFLAAAEQLSANEFADGVRAMLKLKSSRMGGTLTTEDMYQQTKVWWHEAQLFGKPLPEQNASSQTFWVGIERTQFVYVTQKLLPQARVDALNGLIRFAEDCVDRDQYVDFSPEPNWESAVAKWLESYYAALYLTQKEFGVELSTQVCNLSPGMCFYPNKMALAAKHLSKGCQYEDMGELNKYEKMDGMPTLAEVKCDCRAADQNETRGISMNF